MGGRVQEDPDMAAFFQDLQKGGMAAMSKYMADTVPAPPATHARTHAE